MLPLNSGLTAAKKTLMKVVKSLELMFMSKILNKKTANGFRLAVLIK